MEASYPDKRAAISPFPAVVQQAGERVLELFNRYADARLVFHNYQFTAEIVQRCGEVARGENAGLHETEIAQLAGWFLHTGYLIDYRQPTEHSLKEAERFLVSRNYPEEQQRQVVQCIQAVADQKPLPSQAARILSDAYQLTAFLLDFEQRSALLRLEWEFLLHRRPSKAEWNNLQLQHLLQARLHTHYARSKYEPELSQLIHDQKEKTEKLQRKALTEPDGEDSPLRPFQNLEKKRNPTRATQTFFRANFRNHINLSSIADNKANIMISVNSILISVLISLLTYRNISDNQPVVFLPAVIFLVTGLASLIFAVLSARPKVTQFNRYATNKEDIKKNIVFFGNFVHLDLEEYEEAMDAVFRDEELLYGNMTRDLYYLGQVLDKKYRYLSISYNIFMVGFIATVGSFLFLFLR